MVEECRSMSTPLLERPVSQRAGQSSYFEVSSPVTASSSHFPKVLHPPSFISWELTSQAQTTQVLGNATQYNCFHRPRSKLDLTRFVKCNKQKGCFMLVMTSYSHYKGTEESLCKDLKGANL